jgi:hypothetical protein
MSPLQRDFARLRQPLSTQRLHALQRFLPPAAVADALRAAGRPSRCPRLPDPFMVWFVVALGLLATACYRAVFRWLQPFAPGRTPGRSSLCMARQRLGVGPLRRLAEATLVPLARPDTPGAFYAGLRLLALDGFQLALPDSPANRRVFGAPRNQRRGGAFPKVRVVALCEAGTHVLWRLVIKPYRRSEIRMAAPLLKGLPAGCLLLWDRHFYSYDTVAAVRARGSHLLARVRRGLKLPPQEVLADGSYLTTVRPSHRSRAAGGAPVVVRVIRYRLADPARSPRGEEHCLVTTLHEERAYPAAALVALYHQRWEQELAIDELKTHQRGRPVLRSQTPAGVVQEIYGLALGHYVVRRLLFEAAQRRGLDPRQLSFVAGLEILRVRLPEVPRGEAGVRAWYEALLAEVGEEELPRRRRRLNPRVVKQPRVAWPGKKPGHGQTPQPTKPFLEVVVILR